MSFFHLMFNRLRPKITTTETLVTSRIKVRIRETTMVTVKTTVIKDKAMKAIRTIRVVLTEIQKVPLAKTTKAMVEIPRIRDVQMVGILEDINLVKTVMEVITAEVGAF